MNARCWTTRVPLLLTLLLLVSGVALAQWVPLGPDGGDVRSLTYDPNNPERIYLGTSAGQLFLSADNGASWSRFAHLGSGNDYVLDNMEIDPQSGTMYVAAWSVERDGGDLFRSRDGGRTWKPLASMQGKSIRALALAPSDPRIVLVGALDGVFRSRDGGDTFERISPAGHAEIKNIESVAVDPKDPGVVYAGTWHLAWKTPDGGRTWHPIKQGVVDDSDVFSIIVDYNNPRNVYLSACSGIYKSETAAELFHKIQGMPFSARRTRVLKQDPITPSTVYAGTTEGLWKTVDAGKTWRRITPANIIVNDVHVDPRNAQRMLIATDRSGVMASSDAGQVFVASNRGFAHRQVSSVVADRNDARTLYVGLVNDKEFGGVFVSRDSGREWQQISNGIGKLDVFTLKQAEDGALLAGTNHGLYLLRKGATQWQESNTVVREKILPPLKTVAAKSKKAAKPAAPRIELVKSELSARVSQVEVAGKRWLAATSAGMFQSVDSGKTWRGGAVAGQQNFYTVQARERLVLATTPTAAIVSRDEGESWTPVKLPTYVSVVYGGTVTPDAVLWLATREGAVRSTDMGVNWEHVLGGLPARNLASITYERDSGRLLAIAANGEWYASNNAGATWQRQETGFALRSVTSARGRLLAASAFDGLLAQPEPAATASRSAAAAANGGGNE